MTLRTIPAANDDIERRADRLEDERRGRGAKFLRVYSDTIDNIERFPRMYPPAADNVPGLEVRNAVLPHFKLRVIYVVRESETVIVAIDHTSRGSSDWHTRLTDDLYPEEPS